MQSTTAGRLLTFNVDEGLNRVFFTNRGYEDSAFIANADRGEPGLWDSALTREWRDWWKGAWEEAGRKGLDRLPPLAAPQTEALGRVVGELQSPFGTWWRTAKPEIAEAVSASAIGPVANRMLRTLGDGDPLRLFVVGLVAAQDMARYRRSAILSVGLV